MAAVSGLRIIPVENNTRSRSGEAADGVWQRVNQSPLRSPFLQPMQAKSFTSQQCLVLRNGKRLTRRSSGPNVTIVGAIRVFDSNDFEVQRLVSTYGYMNISSYVPPQPGSPLGGSSDTSAAGYDQRDLLQMSGQEVGEGKVQIRVYAGRISRGNQMGTRVLLKAYPGMTARGTVGLTARGTEVDMMAANELRSHSRLQEATPGGKPTHIACCYGGFRTRTGEQWLVFEDTGQSTAADYTKAASKATTEQAAVGQWDFWDNFDRDRPLQRRRIFITKLLRGAFSGVAFMHANDRLHQSLGPASIILNTMEERDAQFLVPQLRDLAFAVDVSNQAMGIGLANDSFEGVNTVSDLRDLQMETPVSTLSEDLWKRAASAGARTPQEQKSFGIADDIYSGGLLLAYVIFVSFCEPGVVDAPSLQRLLESTFRLDVTTAAEYFRADDRCAEAVRFLDLDDGSGWQLLQAMINPNWRMRPTAEAVLSHRFLTGAVL